MCSLSTNTLGLYTGHGVVGTTHAEDVEALVNRVVEQGLPAYLLRELDLVVFPRRVDGERYVGSVVELLPESAYEELPPSARTGVVEKDGTTLYYNTVVWREPDGSFGMAYDHPDLGGDDAATDGETHRSALRVFHRLADATDSDPEAIEREFRRKHAYVEYLLREGITDMSRLFGFLSDLRTDEAATVERVRRRQANEDESGVTSTRGRTGSDAIDHEDDHDPRGDDPSDSVGRDTTTTGTRREWGVDR